MPKVLAKQHSIVCKAQFILLCDPTGSHVTL